MDNKQIELEVMKQRLAFIRLILSAFVAAFFIGTYTFVNLINSSNPEVFIIDVNNLFGIIILLGLGIIIFTLFHTLDLKAMEKLKD